MPELELSIKGKSLKDIIHYYNACRCKFKYVNKWGSITGTFEGMAGHGFICGTDDKGNDYEIDVFDDPGIFRLILHHTGDMTPEQLREYKDLCYKVQDLHDGNKIIRYADTPESMHYLFANAFDAFDLIENGLALDASKVPEVDPLLQEAVESYKPKADSDNLQCYVEGYYAGVRSNEILRTKYNAMVTAWEEIKKAANGHSFYYKSELSQLVANIRKYANDYSRYLGM